MNNQNNYDNLTIHLEYLWILCHNSCKFKKPFILNYPGAKMANNIHISNEDFNSYNFENENSKETSKIWNCIVFKITKDETTYHSTTNSFIEDQYCCISIIFIWFVKQYQCFFKQKYKRLFHLFHVLIIIKFICCRFLKTETNK